MLIEKTLKEALADYIKGKPVTVLWTRGDGSMDVRFCQTFWNRKKIIFW